MDAPLDPLAVAALRAWTPVRVGVKTGEIDWALVDAPFADHFFETTAERAMQHPFNLAFGRRTPLAALDALHAKAPGVAPAGFVFHMSRCGSTLIAQMLARLSATTVLSEPQPLDALLRLRGRVDDDTLIGWLRAMAADAGRMRQVAAVDTKDVGGRRDARAEHADPSGEIDRLAAAWLDAPYAALRAAAR